MRCNVLLAAIATSLAACSVSADEPRGSRVYEAYIGDQRDYIARVRAIPDYAGKVDDAMRIVATMPDEAIKRLEALDYPLMMAADRETGNRRSWATRGTDWTRYAEPHGGYRISTKSEIAATRIATARLAESICAAIQFRTVHGRVEKSGRETQPELSPIGIVPMGIHGYRGTLVADNGERLPVTWAVQWQNSPGDPHALDPLSAKAQTFSLQRLPGAENWTVAGSSSKPIAKNDQKPCISALVRS